MNPIRKIRREKLLRVIDFAILTGMSASQISQVESGVPKKVSEKLLQALERLGYDSEKVQADYIKWREQKQKQLERKVLKKNDWPTLPAKPAIFPSEKSTQKSTANESN